MLARAATICEWQTELMTKEVPAKWMWPLDDELTAHFERVSRDRNADYGIEDDDEPRSAGPMLQNEYALNRGRNAR